MTQWLFRIVPCLAGANASAICLKMLVMRFADVQWPAPLSLHSMFKAHYKCQVIIIIISIVDILRNLLFCVFFSRWQIMSSTAIYRQTVSARARSHNRFVQHLIFVIYSFIYLSYE